MTHAQATVALRGHYRYGACFVDPTSGLRWEAHHPSTRPDRWQQYLDGATREYEKYGLSKLIDRERLARGDGVSVFFVGLDAGEHVTAGFRCHGPIDNVSTSRALSEMATSPEAPELLEIVRGAVPHGVIEIKGAWRAASGNGAHVVADALVRCIIHALEWLGAEVALAAVAERLEALATLTGARKVGTESATYPSERYRTILMAWHRSDFGPQTRPDQATLIRQETEQLQSGPRSIEDAGWRPVVLDARHRSDRQIVANLRADPGIDEVDVADRQRARARPAAARSDHRPAGGRRSPRLLPLASHRRADGRTPGLPGRAARPQPQPDHPRGAGPPPHATGRRGRTERRPLDRHHPGPGRSVRGAPAGRLRRPGADQPEPPAGQRPGHRPQQGGAGRPAGGRDRPLPPAAGAAGGDQRGQHRGVRRRSRHPGGGVRFDRHEDAPARGGPSAPGTGGDGDQ